jgi:hypothetical protein
VKKVDGNPGGFDSQETGAPKKLITWINLDKRNYLHVHP